MIRGCSPLPCAARAVAAAFFGHEIDNRMPEIGKMLVVFGVVIVLLGVALWSGFGAGWLGRLPGDIRIERGHSAFYFPLVTCIIISIAISLLLSLFRR
jgi:hypothetical protein